MPNSAVAMSTDDFADVVEWIEDHWPGSSSKQWQTADKIFDEFRPYTREHGMAAAVRLFAAGSQTAPSPSKLLAAVREVAGDSGIRFEGPHVCALGHIAPTQFYGGLYSSERGPGEVRCAVAGCEAIRPCHCDEECKGDRLYARELRPINADESAHQLSRRSK